MKDETAAPPPPPSLPSLPAPFTHSHPRPRDPSDPTVRPYPRGRPRTLKTIAASAPLAPSTTFADALARERGVIGEGKEGEGDGEGGEGGEGDEVQEDRVRTRVVMRVKAEEKGGEGEGMVDSEVEEVEGEVSYVRVGKPARMRRSKFLAQKRSSSKRRGRVGALLANWSRLNGQGCN